MDFFDLWKVPKYLDDILKNSKDKIITRFPPEPSGYLHIGHAKAIFINYVIAKKYDGIMIMRFDDTNPTKESNEFEKVILEDISQLGIKLDKISHTSDYFDQILELAEHLIKNGLAFVDDSDQETISKERTDCVDSKNRNNSVEINHKLWEDMKQGIKKNSCVRIKMDMSHKNAACRDPTIFRFMEEIHHNSGDKYKVYPTYDFACPIVDSLEGITHVFRSVEFADRDEQFNNILDMLKLRKPLLFSYGKVNFEGSVMGKRKIKDLIEKNIVTGWDDPRLLTIRGLFNRGMNIEPLRQFIAKIGFSKNGTNMTEQMLWSLNKKYIDKFAIRYTAILKNKVKEYDILQKDGTSKQFTEIKDILKFVKNPLLGKRNIYYSNNIYLNSDDCQNFIDEEEITLMNWGNVLHKNNKLIFNLQGDHKTTDKKILWLSRDNTVNLEIITYKGLYEQPEINYYLGEKDLINIKKGDYIQLMKMNYYMCILNDTNKIMLIELPN